MTVYCLRALYDQILVIVSGMRKTRSRCYEYKSGKHQKIVTSVYMLNMRLKLDGNNNQINYKHEQMDIIIQIGNAV